MPPKKSTKKKAVTLIGKAKKLGKGLVKEFSKNPRQPPIGGKRRVKKI
jgi:hypothetical protein